MLMFVDKAGAYPSVAPFRSNVNTLLLVDHRRAKKLRQPRNVAGSE
jgi:hypothetical protein